MRLARDYSEQKSHRQQAEYETGHDGFDSVGRILAGHIFCCYRCEAYAIRFVTGIPLSNKNGGETSLAALSYMDVQRVAALPLNPITFNDHGDRAECPGDRCGGHERLFSNRDDRDGRLEYRKQSLGDRLSVRAPGVTYKYGLCNAEP